MPTELQHEPRQNRILAALPDAEYFRLAGDLEPVTLRLGQVLYESGDPIDQIYFPVTCLVSLVYTTENGSSAELAMTGRDGLLGIPLVLGGETTTHKVVVQGEGIAYRLRAEIFMWELDQSGSLLHLALRYAQALMTQMSQSVVCNRHHSVDQQLCRWLLLSLDQLSGNQLDMTQELIANMLGVRREGVTEAAGKLQTAGLIHYSRGHITVTDRAGLEQRACECYAVVRSEYDRLFKLAQPIDIKNRLRPNPATLRRRAEARLQKDEAVVRGTVPDSSWDTARLMHELEVHQIELEMHNDELRHAYDEADALRHKYADLYDFAPMAYVTLDKRGVIQQLNLAAAILLRVKRSEKKHHRFATTLKEESLPVFDSFFHAVLEGKAKNHCEVVLQSNPERPERLVRIEGVSDEDGEECRMVLMDVRSDLPGQADRRTRD